MTGKKNLWLWILGIVLASAIALTAFFWDTIVIFAAPKAVLTTALSDTLTDLDIRFRYNPVRNLLGQYSPEGRYDATVKLKTDTQHLGPISCDLRVQTDLLAHQAQASGTIGTSGGNLNLSVYLNDTYLALSSQELVNGKYYGLTYDTFASDLERFPLARLLIPESTMTMWENSLEDIQAIMGRPFRAPQITEQDVRLLIAGILLLDSRVTPETLDGQKCFKITYAAQGEEVCDLLSNVLSTEGSATGQITASFYLLNRNLIRVEILGSAGENTVAFSLDLGEQCLNNDLRITIVRKEKGSAASADMTISTASAGTTYRETVSCELTTDMDISRTAVSYTWDSNNGDMILAWNDSLPVRMNVSQTDAGLQIVTEDFAQVMHILAGKKGENTRQISAAVALCPGAPVTVPEYTNLDQWSYEDLMILLKGLGGLLGLPY